MSATEVYTEFINDNLYKKYPLADVGEYSSEHPIPDSFMGDLKIIIGTMDKPGDNSYQFNTYVSQINVYPDYIYVYISTEHDGVIAKSDPIPVNISLTSQMGEREIPIRPVTSLPVYGSIVVGTCKDIARQQGIINVDIDQGRLFPANVLMLPEVVTGIKVGDSVVSGEVILEAGPGISIDYNKDNNTITFRVSDDVYGGSYDKEDFLEDIEEEYGKPIVTINGISPDEDGAFRILATDCLMVDSGVNSITMYNPCGATCESEEFMRDTYTRISDLNKSVATLSSFYTSVTSVLAQLGARAYAVLEK